MKSMAAAKVTAGTAMLISGGMILYSVYTFLSRTAGSGLLLGLVGVFVFYQSYELWSATKRNDLSNHPIFGWECYGDANNQSGASSGVGQESEGDVEVPAQTDEAVMT